MFLFCIHPATVNHVELEPAPSQPFAPRPDKRPLIPEPLPVKLVAVDDVHLPAAAGRELELDAFYVGLLQFQRDADQLESLIYHAENFRLCFDVLEPPIERQDLRPIGIEVPSLADAERKLIEAELEYIRQRGVQPGQQEILLLDPAGNWVALTEARGIM
jgi:hypothetical protein